MKADLFFHATSLEAAQSIVKHGFNSSLGNEIWNISDGKNYFLSVKKTAKEFEWRAKSDFEYLLNIAFDQGQASAACHNSKKRVVFLVDLHGLEYGEDTSCCYPNAVETRENVSPARILKIWIDSHDISAALPFWRKNLKQNRMFNAHNIQADNPWELAVEEGMKEIYIEFPEGYHEEITKKELLSIKKKG